MNQGILGLQAAPDDLNTFAKVAAALGSNPAFASAVAESLLLRPTFDGLVNGMAPLGLAADALFVGSVARLLTGKLNEVISVDDFGADPTGATDSTAAINAAFAYVRAKIASGDTHRKIGGKHYTIYFSGKYLCLGSINATGIAPRSWGIKFAHGAFIWSKAAGKIAFDMYLSRFCKIEGLHVYGDFDYPPAVGLFVSHGVASTTGGCGEHLVFGCEVNGCFSVAALYNFAAEETVFIKSFFRNGYDDTGTAGVYSGYFTATNRAGIASDFQTMYNPSPGSAQSFNGTLLLNTEFCRTTSDLTNTNRGVGPSLLLDDVKSLRGFSYVRQSGAGHAGVTFKSTGRLCNVNCQFIVENNVVSPSSDFPVYLFDPNLNETLRDIEIRDHAIFGRSLIRMSANCRYVHGLLVHAPLANMPLFETEYSGSDATLMPYIRQADIYDTSALVGSNYSTASIDLAKLRGLRGQVRSQWDGFMVATGLTVSRFAGTFIASQGAKRLDVSEDQTVGSNGNLNVTSQLIRASGNGATADVVARITKASVLPYERITIHCMHQLTFSNSGEGADSGNIRPGSGADVVVPQNGVAEFIYHACANVWRYVG